MLLAWKMVWKFSPFPKSNFFFWNVSLFRCPRRLSLFISTDDCEDEVEREIGDLTIHRTNNPGEAIIYLISKVNYTHGGLSYGRWPCPGLPFNATFAKKSLALGDNFWKTFRGAMVELFDSRERNVPILFRFFSCLQLHLYTYQSEVVCCYQTLCYDFWLRMYDFLLSFLLFVACCNEAPTW